MPPRKIFLPSPRYTEAARRAHISGVVIIQTVIDCDGHVCRIQVLKGLPLGLDEESVEAISQWRFEPARVGRVPIRVFFNFTVNFQLQSATARAGGALEQSVTVEGRVARPAE